MSEVQEDDVFGWDDWDSYVDWRRRIDATVTESTAPQSDPQTYALRSECKHLLTKLKTELEAEPLPLGTDSGIIDTSTKLSSKSRRSLFSRRSPTDAEQEFDRHKEPYRHVNPSQLVPRAYWIKRTPRDIFVRRVSVAAVAAEDRIKHYWRRFGEWEQRNHDTINRGALIASLVAGLAVALYSCHADEQPAQQSNLTTAVSNRHYRPSQ